MSDSVEEKPTSTLMHSLTKYVVGPFLIGMRFALRMRMHVRCATRCIGASSDCVQALQAHSA
jgi:hypothetical protein